MTADLGRYTDGFITQWLLKGHSNLLCDRKLGTIHWKDKQDVCAMLTSHGSDMEAIENSNEQHLKKKTQSSVNIIKMLGCR